jgi:hypothetical protein
VKVTDAISIGMKALVDLIRPTPPQAISEASREADHTIEMMRRITEGMKTHV